MLGASIHRYLGTYNFQVVAPSRDELDIRDQKATFKFLKSNEIDTIIHCAAKVGGIAANVSQPADFILNNLQIDTSLMSAARDLRIGNLIYFGSSCMYPKNVTQPMNENQILSGLLEPTNQGYALAKIAGSEIAKTVSQQDKLNWKVLVLSNLYGPGDNFNAESSHLVAAIIAKIYQAKQDSLPEVEIWGSGNSRREFTFVDNVADFVVSNISRVSSWPTLMNLGGGVDYSVNEYYRLVSEIIGYEGRFNHALSKPDGMPKKLLDSSLAIKYGWNPKTDIKVGLLETIRYFEREVWN